MRVLYACVLMIAATLPLRADTAASRLVDAMGIPALIVSFTQDGMASARDLDASFLGGQGGDVFFETVRRLHDPARMEAELRAAMTAALDPAAARQALVFFESDQGTRIIELEVEARRAMVDDALEEAAKAAADNAGDAVLRLLSVRDLVDGNTDIAVAAQAAFFDGLAFASGTSDRPDIESRRGVIAEETRQWLTGYYMLVASALPEDDFDTYIAFWETEVGQAVDDAMYAAFETSYVSLSYGLGQAVGRLMPQNDL
ncbi:MAG: hypothetical protein AAFP87_07160 [Pseudomonadota bacterium]